MAFTRDELANYEKTPPAADEQQAAATDEDSATPVGDEAPAPDSDSSTDEGSEPAVTGDDGSTADEAASAAAADPDSSSGEDEQAEPASRPRHVPYERFQEVVDERNALRLFGKYMQERAGQPKAEEPAPPAPTESAADDIDPMPTLEQFDYDPVAHGAAVQKWVKKQVASGVQRELSTARETQTAEQIKATFDERLAAFKKANPKLDYDTLVGNPNLPKPSKPFALALLKSEHGPAIIAHLASNPDIATRLAKKSVEDQMIEVGRLEAKFSQPAAPAPAPKKDEGKPAANAGSTNAKPAQQPARTRTVSQAPPPPRPVTSGKNPATRSALDPNLSMDDFVAAERQKMIDKRAARQKLRATMR